MAGRSRALLMRIIGAASLATTLAGCYTMRPVGRVLPPTGTSMAFDVTDAGRVALGEAMGPEVTRIEGRLLDAADSQYVVAVTTVRLMRGRTQVWRGERVSVDPRHVGSAYIRRFDRTRSIALGAAIVGGIAALFVTRSLLGNGNDNPDNPGGGEDVRIAAPPIPLWRLNLRGAFP